MKTDVTVISPYDVIDDVMIRASAGFRKVTPVILKEYDLRTHNQSSKACKSNLPDV